VIPLAKLTTPTATRTTAKPAAGESRARREKQLLAAIEGTIEPAFVAWSYRLSIASVALAMIALPVAYVGLIGLACYGVGWHVSNYRPIFAAVGGWGWFVYYAPLAFRLRFIL